MKVNVVSNGPSAESRIEFCQTSSEDCQATFGN